MRTYMIHSVHVEPQACQLTQERDEASTSGVVHRSLSVLISHHTGAGLSTPRTPHTEEKLSV